MFIAVSVIRALCFSETLSTYKPTPCGVTTQSTSVDKAKYGSLKLKGRYHFWLFLCLSTLKNKAVPQNTYGGGERMYSAYSFTTSALDGEWSASRPGRALPPVPIVQEAGWAPEPVWTQRLEEKCLASAKDRTSIAWWTSCRFVYSGSGLSDLRSGCRCCIASHTRLPFSLEVLAITTGRMSRVPNKLLYFATSRQIRIRWQIRE
jgi:hypothetical protein